MRFPRGPIDAFDLPITRLPRSLDGLRILHLSDLHLVNKTRKIEQLIEQLLPTRIDLVALTGDYMLRGHRSEAVLPCFQKLTSAIKPRMGWFGVFGNHDEDALVQTLSQLPVTWLSDKATSIHDVPIDVVGMRCTPRDAFPEPIRLSEAMAGLPSGTDSGHERFRLILSHRPDTLPLAADLSADLMLSGHTHGGQVCLPTRKPLFNSSTLPLRLSSGLLRHRDTLAVVSRGLGNTDLLGSPLRLRLFCPRQAPLITLRCGPSPGTSTMDIRRVWS